MRLAFVRCALAGTWAFVVAPSATAGPTVVAEATTDSVEKGSIFEFKVRLETDVEISDVVIALQPPPGFEAEAVPIPELGVVGKLDRLEIQSLAAGDSITATFRAWPPTIFGNPVKLAGADRNLPGAIKTGEAKRFDVNVRYLEGEQAHVISQKVTVRYTTVLGIYIASGLLGVLLGHVIKVITEDRSKLVLIQEAHPPSAGRRLLNMIRYVSVNRMPSMLTILAIGFGALLVMASDGLPVEGWHQAIALGIGLALLADDKLLEKVRGPLG